MLDKAWDSMIDACKSNMPGSIRFIANQCTAEDMECLSEVFDELVYQTQSAELVSVIIKAIGRCNDDDRRDYFKVLDESVAVYSNNALKSSYHKVRESGSR